MGTGLGLLPLLLLLLAELLHNTTERRDFHRRRKQGGGWAPEGEEEQTLCLSSGLWAADRRNDSLQSDAVAIFQPRPPSNELYLKRLQWQHLSTQPPDLTLKGPGGAFRRLSFPPVISVDMEKLKFQSESFVFNWMFSQDLLCLCCELGEKLRKCSFSN